MILHVGRVVEWAIGERGDGGVGHLYAPREEGRLELGSSNDELGGSVRGEDASLGFQSQVPCW